jgi:hypothetical protein
MNPVEMAHHLQLPTHNSWSGILLLDGKYLSRHMVLLLAVDYHTQDIIAFRIASNESQESYQTLIIDVRACGYTIKALISDGGVGIRALTRKKKRAWTRRGTRPYPRPGIPPATSPPALLEGVPHQWCLVHAQRELLKYVKRDAQKEEREILIESICHILFASTLKQAEKAKNKLHAYGDLQGSIVAKRLVNTLVSYWHLLELISIPSLNI